MMNVHPNMKARINKQLLLEEVRYFQFMYKEITQEINSNVLAVQACEQQIQELLKKNIEDMLFCIQLDNLLEKMNAYIAMALLNEVDGENLHLKYITRLPTLFFKLHLNKIKTLKRITLHNDTFKIIYISPEIGHCFMLEILDCSQCKLSELPETIGSLVNLKKLILSENDIKEIPESIGNLKNLTHFDVSNNTHLGKLPKVIGDLENLKVLKAHHAKLKSLPKEIANCKNLLELYVDHNQLTALPKDIAKLPYLEILYVDHNHLTRLPDDFDKMHNIKIVTLEGNEFKKIPANFLKYCKNKAAG